MKLLPDCFGHRVRLTNERLAHILEHPELKTMEVELERVIREPQIVRRSRSDHSVRLFYALCPQTTVGSKWLCVVIKYEPADAFPDHRLSDNQAERGSRPMADKVKIWFDREADYLEVQFREAPGYMKETSHDAVMERVDSNGDLIGFSVVGISRFTREQPLEAELTAA